MMAMLTRMALSLLRTEESMATPRLVKAQGRFRKPILMSGLEIPIWHIHFSDSGYEAARPG